MRAMIFQSGSAMPGVHELLVEPESPFPVDGGEIHFAPIGQRQDEVGVLGGLGRVKSCMIETGRPLSSAVMTAATLSSRLPPLVASRA